MPPVCNWAICLEKITFAKVLQVQILFFIFALKITQLNLNKTNIVSKSSFIAFKKFWQNHNKYCIKIKFHSFLISRDKVVVGAMLFMRLSILYKTSKYFWISYDRREFWNCIYTPSFLCFNCILLRWKFYWNEIVRRNDFHNLSWIRHFAAKFGQLQNYSVQTHN